MLEQTLGIWPIGYQDTFSKISMIINLIREIIADCVIKDEMVNVVALVACLIVGLLKIMILQINRSKMELVIKSAVDDWSMIEESSSREIMRQHARTGRFVFIYQMASAVLTIVPMAWATLPFLAELPKSLKDRSENLNARSYQNHSDFSLDHYEPKDKNLPQIFPMGTGCFIHDVSPIFYAFIYITQIIQFMASCAGNVGTDVYFFSTCMHVCGQFELLNMKFENFGQDSDFRTSHEQIRVFVKRHNHLMKLSNNVEDSFNVLTLAQLSANAFIMSLLGVQLIIGIKTGNGASAILALSSIYVLSLQLFLYSYTGDYLTSQIEKICYAIYCSHWYNLSPPFVKDLMFIMCRSNRSFNLTAGKVVSMNLDNFKNIFKAMGSYFSVLKLMFDE
ncbi:odorant receptor 22c-like isoform X2 [Venturia canescens]|uniref:odorant receptor 22c-like isoform X2 n=1 Tax=Venturia canescens TaxID=32260 RepID=UPI001C9C1640|nr:odorant receptor 22c-like isoform X2 [Venturia canescens]